MQRIDVRKLREAIKAVASQLQGLKKRQRTPHQPEWNRGPDDWALAKAKTRATVLCSIRAEMRGRLHCLKTRDEQQTFIASALNEFYKEVAVAPAA